MTTGQKEKKKGLDVVEMHNDKFIAMMREYAEQRIEQYGSVTTDNLRRYAEFVGISPKHKNAWGAIFRGNYKGLTWTVVGYKASMKVSNHGRRIAIWTLV